MHQLLQTKLTSISMGSSYAKADSQRTISLNEIISLSSFELLKHLKIPLPIYLLVLTIEFLYMIVSQAQKIVIGKNVITLLLMEVITATGVSIIVIVIFVLMFLQTWFILLRGKGLKDSQTKGNERSGQHSQGSILAILINISGIFLFVLSSALSQFLFRIIPEQFSCDLPLEMANGYCDSKLRQIGQYCSIGAVPLLLFLVLYSDFFLTKVFPNESIPWAAWNAKSRLLRNLYKLLHVVNILFVGDSYSDIVNFGIFLVAAYIIYERYMIPSMYSRAVHLFQVIMESQLFVVSFLSFFVPIAGFQLTFTGLVFVVVGGLLVGGGLWMAIDKKEKEILSVGTDLKNYHNLFDVELYLVMMLHELRKLVDQGGEEYGQQKHIHAIISRHMEECINEHCPCKNYEPEYDKKFTSVASKRITKLLSSAGSMGGSRQGSTLTDMKRLPFKISYKTKVEIFKKEFEDRIDKFLEVYPKAYGVKLLKSFFNHKYCESSFKALFVQLENAQTCKNFKGKVFIYHLKTQIQDEMTKSLESPIQSIEINSLLRFEKHKLEFERGLEDLSYHCQKFWTDLTKEEYKVEETLGTASTVSDKIMDIKKYFSQIAEINPLCIDTSSTYALIYRYILRDEQTFSELVNRIQQIKNSAKLEQQREQGVRFFDSDIYALLMVSGDTKELGRIKQANSSTKFIFGYDAPDLINSRITKLMPAPFAAVHDRFLQGFLERGKSGFMERNQALTVITKEGFLQMTLFYIKPQVSLKYGLIFSCFAKLLNKYTIGTDSPDHLKTSKLCILLTDQDGFIHGLSESCTKMMGLPPPQASKQLYINDNQMLNIQQICPLIMQQEYEFELIKGVNMNVDTSFLNKERQFRREYPDIACKIGNYEAEVGVHKFQYRDYKTEINIFVIKLQEKDDFKFRQQMDDLNSLKSKSDENELTYSEFSITTANSSVISSGVATSKFKTFKSKIQSMNQPSQIVLFQRLSFITFFLLLGIAAGNFAINLIKNHSFMVNLEVLTSLQVLIQSVPEAAHSTRELVLIASNLVQTNHDDIIETYYPSKYQYYSKSLAKSSKIFEDIQKQLNTDLKALISMDKYLITISDLQTDGVIKNLGKSMQTSLNLFSSKILKLSTYNQSKFTNIVVPNISFQWANMTQNQAMSISDIQQDLFFVIQNGLISIVDGLSNIQQVTYDNTARSSSEAATISFILAGVSIVLVLVLLPMNYSPMTHLERISQLILMSLNRLPEIFCQNETKACMELIMFLNEQKEGEKSTHQMIKKHEHRKQNRALLKLPKHPKKHHDDGETNSDGSGGYDSDTNSDVDRSTLLQSAKRQRASNFPLGDNQSTYSAGTNASISSSKVTSLSRLRASTNQYEAQQASQQQKVKRNEGGTIELELGHAKTSELMDDDEDGQNDNRELTEAEIKQKEREKERKKAILATFRRIKLKKFGFLLITAITVALYYAITCFYLNLAHTYEQIYLDDYTLIGQRIQCYSNVASYVIDTLARNDEIEIKQSSNAAKMFLDNCYKTELKYKQLLLDGLTIHANLDTFIDLNALFDRKQLCKTLSLQEGLNLQACQQVLNGLLQVGLPETLFHYLRNMQDILLNFDDRTSFQAQSDQISIIKSLLLKNETNQLISLQQIYLKAAFEYLRDTSLTIIQGYFKKLNSYYNMIFGIFVGLLSLFQFIVTFVLVKKLSSQIVKMYHVVLMVPFSGRTQNDLNRLMMIKL